MVKKDNKADIKRERRKKVMVLIKMSKRFKLKKNR